MTRFGRFLTSSVCIGDSTNCKGGSTNKTKQVKRPQRHAHTTQSYYYNNQQGRVVCIQALSGTGALRVGAAFVGKFMKGTKVFISNPTWGELNRTQILYFA